MNFEFDPQEVPQGSVPIDLPLPTLFTALALSTARMTFSMALALSQKDDTVKANWVRRYCTDLGGVLAEMAVAQWMMFPLTPSLNNFNHADPDIPPDIEVRHTFHPQGCLLVRSKDNFERRYILVTGTGPRLYLIGWDYGYGVVGDNAPWKTNSDGSKVWKKAPSQLQPLSSLALY